MKTTTINKIQKALLYLMAMFLLYVTTVNFIQRFKYHKMTDTELFMHIDESIMLNFKKC